MKRMVRFISRRRRPSSSRIEACVETWSAGDLVADEHARLGRQCPRDRDPLPLATRELRGVARLVGGVEVDAGEQFAHSLAPVVPAEPGGSRAASRSSGRCGAIELRDAYGLWNTYWIARRTSLLRLPGSSGIGAPSRMISPSALPTCRPLMQRPRVVFSSRLAHDCETFPLGNRELDAVEHLGVAVEGARRTDRQEGRAVVCGVRVPDGRSGVVERSGRLRELRRAGAANAVPARERVEHRHPFDAHLARVVAARREWAGIDAILRVERRAADADEGGARMQARSRLYEPARVGVEGSRRSVSAFPSSMNSPEYMTAIVSASPATTARSCVTYTAAVLSALITSLTSSSTRACVITSRPVVGSSSTITFGRHKTVRAMQTRCT